MGSFSGTCEIVEAKDELNWVEYSKSINQTVAHDKRQKHPFLKLGSDNYLHDDINKLFEAISLKPSSKSLHISEQASTVPSRKDALKKPVGVGVPRSPGIGFSEPVSLKQALRRQCISQASEMAAMKRLAKTAGSPRVSEVGKNVNLYRSSSGSPSGSNGGGLEISLVPEERSWNHSEKLPQYRRESKMKSSVQSAHSSPPLDLALVNTGVASVEIEIWSETSESETEKPENHAVVPSLPEPKMRTPNRSDHSSAQFPLETKEKGKRSTLMENETPVSTEVQNQTPELELFSEEKHAVVSSLSCQITDCEIQAGSILASVKLGNKVAAQKSRQKGRVQTLPSSSTAFKRNKGSKPTRKVPHPVKPVRKYKPIVKKNLNRNSTTVGSTSNTSKDITSSLDLSTGSILCERCRCPFTNVGNETNRDSPSSNTAIVCAEVSSSKMNSSAVKVGFTSSKSNESGSVVEKPVKNLNPKEKGEISQSSKSSFGEYSTSTTISEESNLSGSNCGNRPHMSKDMRWEAIRHVSQQHGFLGLGHFSLLKKLGSGDIGTVYLAELIGTNCLFAIKVMDNEFLAKRKKLPRAQTEREILRILDHPFLPTLYAQFTSDNLSCLVMEYCPGGDLHVLRQKQPERYFPEQAARFYVAEVLLALEYLHMLGVIYRDLKPENILVREDGHIMLTDFDLSLRCSVSPTLLKSSLSAIEPPKISGPCTGSSCTDPFCIEPSCQVACFRPKFLPSAAKAKKQKADLAAALVRSLPQLVVEPTDARSNSFVGTHEYLAPEIIKGEGHGSAVDWWTFGIFLYELLYGRTPFKGASGNEETLTNVVLQCLKFPESPLVSFHARDLIRRLLVKEPENRLGFERGAAEIKRHPFFDGLNWALIRCAVPPELPEFCDLETVKGRKYLEYGAAGEHLEFELF
ncbi:hypothetical protein RHGRI_007021 [Rhododendron griersonianum]|uniref:non-specific serine/threonine protein kinase n=1 Tax=Rhododendron griersonianum TaxID=479676 RepID=A0AAV6KVR1_9ERIC|nr:hypothetical protein RHGRI_007021 [Rhododendron griersonianum]